MGFGTIFLPMASSWRPGISQAAGRSKHEEEEMVFDYLLGGGVTIFVTGYLIYALLRPERF